MVFKISNKFLVRSPIFNKKYRFHIPKELDKIQFLESLFISSFKQFDRLSAQSDFFNHTSLLLKYHNRSKTRCTPFGLFAGVSTVKWGENSSVCFTNNNRKTNLDTHLLTRIIVYLESLQSVKENLVYFANNSIYTSGKQLRYIEHSEQNLKRNYILSEAEKDRILNKLIGKAAKGTTISGLVKILKAEGYESVESKEYIHTLIDNQLLISELQLSVTQGCYLEQILNSLHKLKDIEICHNFLNILQEIKERLQRIDCNVTNKISAYEKVIALVDKLEIEYDMQRVFHVDLKKNTSKNTIDKALQETLHDGLEALFRLVPPDTNTHLQNFISRFKERYSEQEVALTQALDNDTGIGYPEPINGDASTLIKEISLPQTNAVSTTWNKRNKKLNYLLQKALLQGMYELEITPKDIEELDSAEGKIPPSFYMLYNVTDFENKKIYLDGVGGQSAVKLLTRFASLDPEMENMVRDIAVEEEKLNPGVLFAEITHLPENKSGDLFKRPPIRKYEIPYINSPSVEEKFQIPITDLYVSLKNNKLILRSKRLNKQIIPTLSTAHNYSKSELPVYRFLCDMHGAESVNNLTFQWGNWIKSTPFLPRVSYKNAILSLATWQLPKHEWENLLNIVDDNLIDAVNDFRKQWKMPKHIVLAEGDNELFVNLEDLANIKMFLSTIKNKNHVVLKEFMFDENTPIIDNEGKPYANQFVQPVLRTTPFYKVRNAKVLDSARTDKVDSVRCSHSLSERGRTDRKVYSRTNKKENSVTKKPQQIFTPGSEWLYYKLYCSPKVADELLSTIIKKLRKKLKKERFISNWFFIRYKDKHFHIRLRFRLTDIKHHNIVIESVTKSLNKYCQNGMVWKVTTDTYLRELERYGHNTMELAEKLFEYDSTTITQFLSEIKELPQNDDIRWLMGMKTIDSLLNTFGLKIHDKKNLLEDLKTGFTNEFKLEKQSRLKIDKNYRNYTKVIAATLGSNNDESPLLDYLIIINDFEKKISKIAPEIISISETKTKLFDYLMSYIHMHINRLLPHSHRLNEMVIYDYMYRYYRSEIAKVKYKK